MGLSKSVLNQPPIICALNLIKDCPAREQISMNDLQLGKMTEASVAFTSIMNVIVREVTDSLFHYPLKTKKSDGSANVPVLLCFLIRKALPVWQNAGRRGSCIKMCSVIIKKICDFCQTSNGEDIAGISCFLENNELRIMLLCSELTSTEFFNCP